MLNSMLKQLSIFLTTSSVTNRNVRTLCFGAGSTLNIR